LGDGVGATGDVEVQDLAVLLAKSQTLPEEERVETIPRSAVVVMRRKVSKSICEPLAGSDQIVVWFDALEENTPKCTCAPGRGTSEVLT